MPFGSTHRSLLIMASLAALVLAGCSRKSSQFIGPDASSTRATRTSGPASSGGGKLFVSSAHENGDGTVTLPLYHGTSKGRTVWFIVLDASSGDAADQWGVNESQKLEHLRGTQARL